MKFNCSRTDLSNAIMNVQRAVATKASIPALEGILIKVKGDKLNISGYDLETGITTDIEATILEEGRELYEVLDLGMGKCRMCVAGPESARELLGNGEIIRVATKYPHIAKDYFVNQKHQTVELIKLNGSIELAPIVGLSDVIVDIVETGSTLKENGLVVLEDVCPLSARVVVNRVSMKMEQERD